MTEEKEKTTPKSRIESLSDLIFGLALSIGALTLIGEPASNLNDLIVSLLYFAFSFLILINVWFSYTRTMSNLHAETRSAIYLNVILLFLVSIEPYLFNELGQSSFAQSVSVIYALDLGGLFIVLGLLQSLIAADKSKPPQFIRHHKILEYAQFVGAAIFLVSILPIFWSWQVQVSGYNVPLRLLLWIVPLFMRLIRQALEKAMR